MELTDDKSLSSNDLTSENKATSVDNENSTAKIYYNAPTCIKHRYGKVLKFLQSK